MPSRDEKTERFEIRLEKWKLDRWEAAASAEGLNLSDWIRRQCDARTDDPEIEKLVAEVARVRAKRLR